MVEPANIVALRLQGISLPATDVPEIDRFYRWVLQLKTSPESSQAAARDMSWGNEDRVRILDAEELAEAEESVTLRMPAMPFEEVAEWCASSDLRPIEAVVSLDDRARASETWTDVPVEVVEDDAAQNRTLIAIRGPGGQRFELLFPIPKEVLVPRQRIGPFYWRSKDWRGLEIPGLLGVTSGLPDLTEMAAFCAGLGMSPLGDEDDAPLAIGDHQWVLQQREQPGIYGFAVVVPSATIQDLKRTLDHLEADHRHEGNRILAADPAGRVILIHGIRAA